MLAIEGTGGANEHAIDGILPFAPLLRTLDWQYLPFSLASTPSSYLTTLYVDGDVSFDVPPETLGRFLETCPSLCSLVIDQYMSLGATLSFNPPTFHLPQLHTYATDAESLLLFRNTTSLPALRNLRLRGCSSSIEFETMLRFRHIHLLTSLQLKDCHPTAELMDEVLRATANLVDLSFNNCVLFTPPSLSGPPRICLKLRKFDMVSTYIKDPQSFLDFIRARTGGATEVSMLESVSFGIVDGLSEEEVNELKDLFKDIPWVLRSFDVRYEYSEDMYYYVSDG